MKRVAFALLLCLASQVFAAERFTAAAWRRVKVYDMDALKTLDPAPLRQFVGVRFQYRNRGIEHWKPNWFESSIWNHRRAAADQFDYIPVLVSQADLAAFETLPSNPDASGTRVVYGQILKDYDANFTFLRLIGTRVIRERGSRVVVSW